MIEAFVVIVLVVGFYAIFARGQKSDAAAFRDGEQRDYSTSDGNYSSDGDGE